MDKEIQPTQPQPKKKLQIIWYLLIGAGLLFIGGLIGYHIRVQKDKVQNKLALQSATSPTDTPYLPPITTLPSQAIRNTFSTHTPDSVMPHWQTYTDTNSGVSFKYPPSWSRGPGELIPDGLSFTVTGGNPKMDPIRIEITIETNAQTDTTNWTPDQWFAYIIKKNNAPDLQYEHLTISGYPAIKNTQTIAYEEYEVIAPVKNFTTQNAEYLILFSNVGEMQEHPYPLTDPFLQQANADFHRMLSTLKINQ